MLRRVVLPLTIGFAVAAVCVRLGVWQLDRLEQRRAMNAAVEARWSAAPVPLSSLPSDTALARHRRARVEGRFDYDNELVLIARTRDGAPGVHLITPLLPNGSAPAVLVNRGWVYSPDGATVDLARWREAARGVVEGYVQTFAAPGAGNPRATAPRAWRRLDARAIAEALPYPMEPFYVVALDDVAGGGARRERGRNDSDRASAAWRPSRLPPPERGEGPHKSYAVQWFSFAAIALVGTSALVWQDTRRRRGSSHRRMGTM
jgi:surfeit locus 1 family protein